MNQNELPSAVADEIDRLRKLDAEYGRVEAAIIMSCPGFDGDSDHENCGDRLIAAVEDLAARNAQLEAVVKAYKRAEAVPRTSTLIDSLTDDEMFSEEADDWKIEVGTLKGEQNDE